MLEGGGLYWRAKFMLEKEERFVLVGERFMLESRSSRRVKCKRESPDFGSSGWHLWLCKCNQF